jgi:signal transduction histidine kinase
MDQFTESTYDHLLEISKERISLREEERKSIAREIHDEVGQALVALKIDVSYILQKLALTDPEVSRAELTREIQSIASKISNSMEIVRRVIAGIRPEAVNKLGLRGAIEWQAHEFEVRTGIPVEIRSDLETITMRDPNFAMALFRIFQEVLTNVGRHAMASRVETTIREETEFLLMQIKDNGRGIHESDLKKDFSFGLLGLKERVFLLQGEMDIQGVPDVGTTVSVRIPLYLCENGR